MTEDNRTAYQLIRALPNNWWFRRSHDGASGHCVVCDSYAWEDCWGSRTIESKTDHSPDCPVPAIEKMRTEERTD